MPKVTLINYTQNPEQTIEQFAKVSHCSKLAETAESRNFFIECLIKNGHESVLEVVDFTFLIEDVSRVTTHQLVRHRLASYCQESERYVKMNNDFIVPNSIENSNFNEMYKTLLRDAYRLYNVMIENKIPKEDARYILPQAKTTSIMVKMNVRELRHFFKLRLDSHAQWEIQDVAGQMRDICKDKCFIAFRDV
jgi:thymidylate synthase (FAD)